MASISSPPSGSRTESTLPTTALTADEADWHASRFRASWEPPQPVEAPPVEPAPAAPTALEDDDRADPIELHRVASSAPPPRNPVPAPAAAFDSVPSAPVAGAGLPPGPGPAPPAAVPPRSAEAVVPAVVPERDFGNDSVDLPLRAGLAFRLPLWIGGGAVAAFGIGIAVWALAPADEEVAAVEASAPREEPPLLEPVAVSEVPEPSESAPSALGSADETPVAEVMPTDEPAVPDAPPVVETVSVSLRVTPRFARVEVDGELWRAPFRRSLPRSDEVHRVVVSRRGYETAERELVGDEDHNIAIRLRRQRPAARNTQRGSTTRRPAVVRRSPPPTRGSPTKRPNRRRRRLGAGFTTSNPY